MGGATRVGVLMVLVALVVCLLSGPAKAAGVSTPLTSARSHPPLELPRVATPPFTGGAAAVLVAHGARASWNR